jgi:XTP/dITP diphosphohydrolase
MDLLVATHNAGKMAEFRALLAPLSARVLFPPDLGLRVEVREEGATYGENARIKAQAYAQATRGATSAALLVLADDSGLEVDLLDGAPGIRSARYTQGSDTDRVAALLTRLQGVPVERRTARFRCVMIVVGPDDRLYSSEGTCEGVIALTPAGEGGFGYDPVFYLPEFRCTMAELPAATKNRVSHRARAVQVALPTLRRLLASAQPTAGAEATAL